MKLNFDATIETNLAGSVAPAGKAESIAPRRPSLGGRGEKRSALEETRAWAVSFRAQGQFQLFRIYLQNQT